MVHEITMFECIEIINTIQNQPKKVVKQSKRCVPIHILYSVKKNNHWSNWVEQHTIDGVMPIHVHMVVSLNVSTLHSDHVIPAHTMNILSLHFV